MPTQPAPLAKNSGGWNGQAEYAPNIPGKQGLSPGITLRCAGQTDTRKIIQGGLFRMRNILRTFDDFLTGDSYSLMTLGHHNRYDLF